MFAGEKDAKALMEKCVPLEIPPKYRSLPVLTGILHYCSCTSSDAVSLTVLYVVCCSAGLSLVNVVPEQFVWLCVFDLTLRVERFFLTSGRLSDSGNVCSSHPDL